MHKQRIIWSNGCFDILHRGHIELFKYAKSLGDYLVVGIDTDQRVANSKGPSRPVNCLIDRVAVLEAIRYIDKVTWFATDEELSFNISKFKANAIVVGNDYVDRNVIGSHLVDEVIFFEKLNEYSTTKILQHPINR